MRAIFRDLARQRWRTLLTIAGMAIGIFALVVLGAMAEHFRSVVADAKGYVRGTVRLVTKTNKKGENPGISPDDIAQARALPGVRDVAPTLTLLFDGYNLEDDPLIFLTPKPLVEGLSLRHAERMRPGVHLLEGRWLKEGDESSIMVVRWLAL
ncbi:ABC transporter permease, partial [bacterium]|nr:ABC transporter permease [bacterium]